jgi:MauM/NapG family ferredoxin protein
VALNWFLRQGKGKAGPWRRWVRRLAGPTWLATPLRRTVQTLSLSVFLVLFLYVSWPYTAQRPRTWFGWVPVSVDETTGTVRVAAEHDAGDAPAAGTVVFPIDSSLDQQSALGAFRVRPVGDNELLLEPAGELTAAQLDQLAISFGPWQLHQADPDSWPSHYADDLAAKQLLPAETFLSLDPLVGLSTAVAARSWIPALLWAGGLLLVCLLIPRAFCGYLCPLGTLLDVFDRVVGRRFRRLHVSCSGWWAGLKYILLAGILAAAAGGAVISGYLAAIPVLTRGLVFTVKPLQTAAERGWHQVPPFTAGQWLSLALLAGVFLLGLLGRRFWCRCVCPTGAVFSLANLLRITERKVSERCISCGKCVGACAFGAVAEDFATKPADCAFCQTCGGVCPVGAIQFAPRWTASGLRPTAQQDSAAAVTPAAAAVPRRGFLATAAGLAAGAVGGASSAVALSKMQPPRDASETIPLVRPPGSVPEQLFLQMCIRCGACLQACPNDVLQPAMWNDGLVALWTPRVAADWSGCESSCNNCGHVCPTGAIRALPLDEKRVARMGLAVVNQQTCLPYAGRGECQLCVDECDLAGYHAIEFLRVGTELDASGQPIADSGFLAPVVLAESCVGCGLCQARCYAMNARQQGLLAQSAIIVRAGEGREDRLRDGSYLALRQAEQQQRQREKDAYLKVDDSGESYLPDFLK